MNRFRALLLVYLLACTSPLLAQHPGLHGGAGFFQVGYGRLFHFSRTLSAFAPATSGLAGNDFISLGGGGYARLNKAIVGGGGYALIRQGAQQTGYRAEPFGGGGYLYAGRILVDTRRFWAYPMAGAGVSVVGLTQYQQQGQTVRESSVLMPGLSLRLGVGADWLVVAAGDETSHGGLMLGLRAGFQFSPASSGWRSSGDVLATDRPTYATNGFFVTLAIGAGGFRLPLPNPIVH